MTRLLSVILLVLFSTGIVRADVAPPPKKDGGDKTAVEPWFSEQDAGWIGGFVGGSVGLLGAAYGIMAGLGVARQFVLNLSLICVGTGILLVIVGLSAVGFGQPYHVYFLPLLIGALLACIMGFNYPILKRRYEQMELQRMSAMDA